jgi:hypothetical protein
MGLAASRSTTSDTSNSLTPRATGSDRFCRIVLRMPGTSVVRHTSNSLVAGFDSDTLRPSSGRRRLV